MSDDKKNLIRRLHQLLESELSPKDYRRGATDAVYNILDRSEGGYLKKIATDAVMHFNISSQLADPTTADLTALQRMTESGDNPLLVIERFLEEDLSEAYKSLFKVGGNTLNRNDGSKFQLQTLADLSLELAPVPEGEEPNFDDPQWRKRVLAGLSEVDFFPLAQRVMERAARTGGANGFPQPAFQAMIHHLRQHGEWDY